MTTCSCGVASIDALAHPFVLRQCARSWTCFSWQWGDWIKFFSDLNQTELLFRLGFIEEPVEQQWEHSNGRVSASLADFLSWSQEPDVPRSLHSSLSDYDPAVYWAYHAYAYMCNWADHSPHVVDRLGVDWSCAGLSTHSARDSVFWLGSRGAHSLCHYDTYGCNVVAQIRGRKRWTLFPPEDSCFLYPTRLPHEESTVFTQANLRRPDLEKFPELVRTRAHTVLLSPGDVLFVPRHWWHLVESLDTSLSINTWIPLAEDHVERLHEFSVSKCLQCLAVDRTEVVCNDEQKEAVSWHMLKPLLDNALSVPSACAFNEDLAGVRRSAETAGENVPLDHQYWSSSSLLFPSAPLFTEQPAVNEVSCFLQALTHPDIVKAVTEKFIQLATTRRSHV